MYDVCVKIKDTMHHECITGGHVYFKVKVTMHYGCIMVKNTVYIGLGTELICASYPYGGYIPHYKMFMLTRPRITYMSWYKGP